MKQRNIILLLIVVIIAGVFVYLGMNKFKQAKKNSTVSQPVPAQTKPAESSIALPVASPSAEPQISKLAEPVKDFRSRITKKFFGTYITPQNSPVQPEKFTGYHTGVDAEYADVAEDTPIYAISDGVVEYSGTVSGYGGVLVIKHQIDTNEILCLYGHVAASTIPAKGSTVTKGQALGRLGHDKSQETGGERKHLHFGMIKGDKIDFRGYVQTESELNGWYNPLDYY